MKLMMKFNGFEWFVNDGHTFGVLDSNLLSFDDVPDKIKKPFIDEYKSNNTFVSMHEGLTDDEKLIVWVKMHYWKLDNVPDLDLKTGRLSHDSDDNVKLLTPREIEVIIELALGNVDKKSCEVLRITLETYHRHIKNIKKKLGFSSKVEITAFAFKNHIVC